jgi:hypothetical protein
MDEKQLAAYEKVAEQAFNTSQSSYADLSKWILASLLALNGGALLAVVQVFSSYPRAAASMSPMLFLMGSLFAVVSGYAARKKSLVTSEVFLKFLVAGTNDERAKALNDGLANEKRFDRLADFSIAMSGVALIVGAVFIWIAIPVPTALSTP